MEGIIIFPAKYIISEHSKKFLDTMYWDLILLNHKHIKTD